DGLACRACDWFGVPLVGVAETTAVLPLDKVEPLMVRGRRVIGAGGLPEVRLRCSELCMEDQVPPLRQLRLLFGAQQGVMQQQEKWSDEWGSVIDWKRVIRVRDSAVLPNRAQDVLLHLHCRNLQVGVRLKFLEGVACPHCGEEETAEHCLFGCPRIQPVVRGLLKALQIINPGRKITSLGDLLFQKEGSSSGFPESTITAIALHQIWVQRCDAAFERGRFRSRRVLRRIAAAFYTYTRIYLRAKKRSKRAGVMLGPGQRSILERLDPDEFRLVSRVCDSSAKSLAWTGGFTSIWANPRTIFHPP
ncbi:unnamed protein product, partial [Closterium sp. NIES-53]